MSYQTFYRKYRPSDLDDVSGQQSIVKIIRNSLKFNRINHAYLFCGPRGTGKTTMARILAKNVNCLDLQDGMACGKCKNCISILNGNCPDIIEMDAASNNGIDEIREIRNKVSLVPTELKYKVYVIDEVHMLSIGAFNALLKTLEEPPEHVIFILATTDMHKVPNTIVSRCQCLDFHRVREEDIIHRLNQIVEAEKITIESEIIEKIANLSDGGFRDAIGMLDKLVSYSNENITMIDFEELNGIVSQDEKIQFLKIIEKNDIKKVIEFIDKIYNGGKDLIIFSQDLMILCRNLIIDYYSYEKTDFDIEFLLLFVEKLDEIILSLKNTNNTRIIFETKILSFIYQKSSVNNFNPIENEKVSLNNQVDLEDKVIEKEVLNSDQKVSIEEENNSDGSIQEESFLKKNEIIINNCFCNASKQKLNFVKENWKKLNDYALDSHYGAVACYLSDATVRAASDHEIIITFDYESVVTRGFKFNYQIEQLLKKILEDDYYVAYLTDEQWNREKSKYIENKNNGINYTYQNLEDLLNQNIKQDDKKTNILETVPSDGSIAGEAIKLFGENIVSVDE